MIVIIILVIVIVVIIITAGNIAIRQCTALWSHHCKVPAMISPETQLSRTELFHKS